MVEFHERMFVGGVLPPRTRMVGQFRIEFQLWSVYEDDSHGRALIFECEGIARRVRQYPANWRELSAEELYALSWSR